eukprot:scaffold1583_cov105-Isochrysis_galbana.AAC.10
MLSTTLAASAATASAPSSLALRSETRSSQTRLPSRTRLSYLRDRIFSVFSTTSSSPESEPAEPSSATTPPSGSARRTAPAHPAPRLVGAPGPARPARPGSSATPEASAPTPPVRRAHGRYEVLCGPTTKHRII